MKQVWQITVGSVLAMSLGACGGVATKDWSPDRPKTAYSVAYRKTAPPPVYNRLRWVHLPETMPERETAESTAPSIFPVFHLDLKNASLEEASQALAASARYDSYCASDLAHRKISLNRLGTLDELAQEIASSSGITVQVDHDMKTVRFLPKLAPQPEFAPEGLAGGTETGSTKEVTEHEHKSDN